ncbi:hypothetical protein MNBD_NITROSPIRAE01-280 [hydrothermal vent metagenome]|uniref:Uncharacterized protein n=1 Tax=hydrothermal vent metagenome TaxID=652676 RepID=A0A3B1CJQ1_9ZZZZ
MSPTIKGTTIWLTLLITLIVFSRPVSAGELDIEIKSSISAPIFKDFSKEIGLAISYLPLAPAEPLGILGFDIGIEVTVIDIDKGLWRNVITDNPPDTLVLPRIHLQKGLPFGFDIGASYTKLPSSNIKVIGGEIKWAILSGNAALPALAIRGSYTTLSGVDDLNLETMGADISISKGFLFVTPYAGYGQVWIDSEEKVTPFQFKEKINVAKPFVGAKISLALINFVFQADFGDLPMYTARLNVGF